MKSSKVETVSQVLPTDMSPDHIEDWEARRAEFPHHFPIR